MSSISPIRTERLIDAAVVERSLSEMHHKLNLIIKYLNIFYEKDNKMSYDLSSLLTAVQNEKTVEQSLMALVQGLSQRVASLAAQVMDDKTKQTLADLANELNTNAAAMSASVTAGTSVVGPTSTTASDTNTVVAPNVVTPATSATTAVAPTTTEVPSSTSTTTAVNPSDPNVTPKVSPVPVSDTGSTKSANK